MSDDMTTAPPAIELRDFAVRYPLFQLHPLDLTLAAGERIALVGPNGAGKTTVLRALSGRLPEYTGEVLFAGREARTLLPGLRESVGIMPDRVPGFTWMTVRQHLEFLARFYTGWDREYERELVDRLELPYAARLGRLSRGMQAKLAFIAAESFRPPVLLLDEPTSGLDPLMRRLLIDAVRESLARDAGRLVVFSTHILEDVEWLAERVLVLRDGRLRADRPAATLVLDGSLSQNLYKLLEPQPAPGPR
jgi:ABC-2 type transport system ATP-binding protein